MLTGLLPVSPEPAMLARGDDPPEPPRRSAMLAGLLPVSPEPAMLGRGDDPPEPPRRSAMLTGLRPVSPEPPRCDGSAATVQPLSR
jgi:hypothetical protein